MTGCVAYKSGERSAVPAEAIDTAFKKNVTYFLDLLEAPAAPVRTPNVAECRYCDITVAECPERIGADVAGMQAEGDAEIPL
ncbi:MAG: hypothetical protein Q8P50_14205 [Bacillota bacterium]|nr:hypothetical protein [Bacillota bacterium]